MAKQWVGLGSLISLVKCYANKYYRMRPMAGRGWIRLRDTKFVRVVLLKSLEGSI